MFLEAVVLATALPAAAGDAHLPLRADGRVLVADLARTQSGGELELARFDRPVRLDAAQQAQLVRNRLPGVPFALKHTGVVSFEFRGPRPSTLRPGTRCFAARVDMPAGHPIDADDLVEAPCTPQRPDANLGYAASGYHARRAIPAGAYLGPLRPAAAAPLPSGAAMTLRTRIGPVIVERQVETLQPARPGRRVFVRTEDGQVLASRIARPTQGDER